MKTLRNISRLIVGVVLIFSGFVKGIDPLGSAYKFQDYFAAFGMDFFDPLAMPLGVLLSTFEFVLGAALMLNIRSRITSWVVLIFMGFFTVLTLYLALENPVHDCGCFGDAIVMTNWETFWKNVVIMAFVAILFIERRHFKNVYSRVQQWGLLASTTLIMLAFTFYSYHHLPIFDFRPYNIGTHIPSKMEIPEDAPQPEYKTILKYKKNGEIREFTVDSLPDSTWQWVETENIQISKGYTPPIEGFSITTLDGSDITDIVLNEEDYTFLLIAYDLKKANRSDMKEVKKLSELCRNNNQCQFIALTASTESDIEKFREATDVQFPFYHTDEITLKTVIRSNPGLMLINNGTILDKWHHNDIPATKQVKLNFLNTESEKKDPVPQDEQGTDEELPS
jgi:uncharacterized membrane protein YphA (DoxX/SURF4 family)